jgi:RNA polymerase sigma-70 factor (ECF subfamily)
MVWEEDIAFSLLLNPKLDNGAVSHDPPAAGIPEASGERVAEGGPETPRTVEVPEGSSAEANVGLQAERTSIPPGGDEARARFESLITEHLDGLYRSALRLTRNRTVAEDLVQDTMLKAWRSSHTFQEGTNVRAWFHRIMMNAHYDNYRKHTREPEVADLDNVGDFYLYDKVQERTAMGEAGNPEVSVLDKIMDVEVRESLDALPVQFRSAVILADVQGFTYKEIAEILGIPVGTVMSRLSRGRHMLQSRLWKYARDRHYIQGAET